MAEKPALSLPKDAAPSAKPLQMCKRLADGGFALSARTCHSRQEIYFIILEHRRTLAKARCAGVYGTDGAGRLRVGGELTR
jgi:hypothetical protein